MKIKLYYVAYDYGHGLEMISGPYGTSLEAYDEYDTLRRGDVDKELKVVYHYIEVEE